MSTGTVRVPYIYHICTCWNCLPEDSPAGSKQVLVDDIVKHLIKHNRGAFCWSTLYNRSPIHELSR